MTRTTPPRPLDIATVFPELHAYATTATRLHPRPGDPSAAESSIGGPLLWPVDEPWPTCTDGAGHYEFPLLTPTTVRRRREIYAASAGRRLTDEERAQLPPAGFSEPRSLLDQPLPMIPIAQLYRRDVPDFAGPDDTDLLQVLWCPLGHPDLTHHPRVRLYWRRSADVDRPLRSPPEPPVVKDSYLPNPCVVHPEQIREYQYGGRLPTELDTRILDWQESSGLDYECDLSLAPGWKVGGFANWSLTEPDPAHCATCGAPMTLLFTAASSEADAASTSWRPLEEPAGVSGRPTGVWIGRGHDLYIQRCPVSFDHQVF